MARQRIPSFSSRFFPSANDNLLEPRDAPYVHSAELRFFSNSPPPAFHGAQPIPHFPSSPTFSTSCYFQRQAAVKSPLLCLSNTWILFLKIQAVQISSFSFPICSPFFSSAKVNRMCTEFLSTIVRLIKELWQLYLYNSQIFTPCFYVCLHYLILILCHAFCFKIFLG